jgi:hypothetical protein
VGNVLRTGEKLLQYFVGKPEGKGEMRRSKHKCDDCTCIKIEGVYLFHLVHGRDV